MVLPFLLWQAAKPSPGRIANYIHHDTQGAALGYVLLPLRGVLLVSFDTLSTKQVFQCFSLQSY